MNGYQSVVYETDLKMDQIKEAVYTESENISVRWHLSGKGFNVWKRERPHSSAFVLLRYFHVSAKVKITQTDERTLVRISGGPVARWDHTIIYVAVSALILLIAGKSACIDIQSYLMTMGLITAFYYALQYCYNRLPEFGYELYKDTVRWLEHVLELKKVKE